MTEPTVLAAYKPHIPRATAIRLGATVFVTIANNDGTVTEVHYRGKRAQLPYVVVNTLKGLVIGARSSERAAASLADMNHGRIVLTVEEETAS